MIFYNIGMNDQRRSATSVWIVVITAALLFLYPLSIGPVGWMIIRCGSPSWTQPTFELVYAPLIWLQDHGPVPVSKLINWYFALWWG
jgi:hypothetical protein